MSGEVIPGRRGRPRSESARQAILAAAADLLRERGLRATSADDIAARAGVSKATIYRWWDSKEAVALDAFLADLENHLGTVPDTGTLRGDLLADLRARGRMWARDPALGRTQAALIAESQADASLRAGYRSRVMAPLRQVGRAMFDRASARGEIRPGVDIDLALDLLYGALYHRLFNGHAPIDDAFLRNAVDTVLHGIGSLR